MASFGISFFGFAVGLAPKAKVFLKINIGLSANRNYFRHFLGCERVLDGKFFTVNLFDFSLVDFCHGATFDPFGRESCSHVLETIHNHIDCREHHGIFYFFQTYYIHFFVSPLNPDTLDDAFHGLFGIGGLGGHVLCIFNIIYAFRYSTLKQYQKAMFFGISAVLGFYGLGFILAIMSLLWLNRRIFLQRKLILRMVSGVIIFFAVASLIKLTNPQNYRYIESSISSFLVKDFDYEIEIDKARRFRTTAIPRKITFLAGVVNRIRTNPEILLYGISPGTYNSRTAFLLNGDLSRTGILRNSAKYRPPYHESDIFYLFNSKSIEISWMGGTRHQPFSSIVSILIEYGLLVALLIFFTMLNLVRRTISGYKTDYNSKILKFTSVLTLLLFFMVYYFEVIEFMLPILLMFKCYEVDMKRPTAEVT